MEEKIQKLRLEHFSLQFQCILGLKISELHLWKLWKAYMIAFSNHVYFFIMKILNEQFISLKEFILKLLPWIYSD